MSRLRVMSRHSLLRHVRVNGITHEATAHESNDLLYLSCETRETQLHPWMCRKFHKSSIGVDVGLAVPVDCMACLVCLTP